MIQVMDALVRRATGECWGVRELAAELSESRSTVNRILVSLVEVGLASEVGVGKYSIGPRMDVLAKALTHSSVLTGSSGKSLSGLADTSDCTALVSVYSPDSNGYFIAACSEAEATLTFRPQLGVMYPLAFGDIGRKFAEFIGTERLDGSAPNLPADRDGLFPVRDASGLMSESEFPGASWIIVKKLTNGLTVSVSVHSVGSSTPKISRHLEKDIQSVIEDIQDGIASESVDGLTLVDSLPVLDAKSTIGRFERLLRLACGFPQGVKNSIGTHDLLFCNVATAKRLLESGVQAGLIRLVGGTLYPGPRLYQWATRINSTHRDMADVTRNIISSLVQETGETIALLSYDETSQRAEFLEVIQGWRPIQYKLQVKVDVPLYAGAAGKAVLAYCDPRLVESLKLERFTDATITSRDVLKKELRDIQERGWATGEGERVLGAFGLAVPFFVDGRIRGSISATIPQYRKDERDLAMLSALMRETTGKIERLLSLGLRINERC